MGMMNYTYQDMSKKLHKLGFRKVREGKGSHEIREHEDGERTILIPHHGSTTLSKGVIKQIISCTGLNNKDFSHI